MKYEVLVAYDKLYEGAAPAYDDKQISAVLTKAQLRVVRNLINPVKNKIQKGFEMSEERRRQLEQLLESGSISGGDITESSNQDAVHPKGTLYDLPDSFWLAIEEAAVLTASSDEVIVKPVTHDEYMTQVKNPYKKPSSELVWRMDISRVDHGEDDLDYDNRTAKRTELIVADKATDPVIDYRVRYISFPTDIVCDEITPSNQRHCILDESLHVDIVDEAVSILTAATEPSEYQIAFNEKQQN